MADKPKNPKHSIDPFGDKMFFSDDLGDIFDSHHPYGRPETGFLAGRSFNPAVDIHECADGLLISLEVPGMRREEINLELNENVLTVTGSRNFKKDHEQEEHIRLERGFGSFRRMFEVPGDINPSAVSAKLENGVLMITVPRLQKGPLNIPVISGD